MCQNRPREKKCAENFFQLYFLTYFFTCVVEYPKSQPHKLHISSFSLFFTKNPLLVILGFLTAYELVRRSKKYGTYEHVDGYLQEETAKNEERIVENNIQMMKVNDTLEQDMVENITPLIPRAHGDPTYAPVADKKHNASEANGNTMLDI